MLTVPSMLAYIYHLFIEESIMGFGPAGGRIHRLQYAYTFC